MRFPCFQKIGLSGTAALGLALLAAGAPGLATVVTAPILASLGATPAVADDGWNPFRERDQRRAREAARKPAPDPRPALPSFSGETPWRPGPGAGAPPAGGDGWANAAPPGGGQPQPWGSAPSAPGAPGTYLPPAGNGQGAASYGVERVDLAPLAPVPPGLPGAAGPSGAPPSAGAPAHQGGWAATNADTTQRAGTAIVAPQPGDRIGAIEPERWRGLDAAAAAELIRPLAIPPRSTILHDLWRHLLASQPSASSDPRLDALRIEALYRSGLLDDARAVARGAAAAANDPTVEVVAARLEILAGDRDAGCASIKTLGPKSATLPKLLAGELIVLAGYCAAVSGNKSGAGLAAELARDQGGASDLSTQLLDAVANGGKAPSRLPKTLTPIDYKLAMIAGGLKPGDAFERADPPLFAVLAAPAPGGPADQADPRLTIAAGEAAARLNIISPTGLAALYRTHASEGGDPLSQAGDPLTQRARLFRAAERERSPLRLTRLIRALVDDARRNGLYLPMLVLAADLTERVNRVPEIGWFAETAIEATLAAGHYDKARAWAVFAAALHQNSHGQLDHWRSLIDIADPALAGVRRGQSLDSVEAIAARGRLTPDMLHRLATVLDALDYNVPIPLWDAANRTPQPNTGHLPPTGVLPLLADAAKKREQGRTVLLVLQTLGPNGAEGANILGLGDSIRALKRAGLEPAARRLGLEALFAGWPRMVGQ